MIRAHNTAIAKARAQMRGELLLPLSVRGGNSGIVTLFEFQLYPIGTEVLAVCYLGEEEEDRCRVWNPL